MEGALAETRDLLSHKWDFTVEELKAYQDKVASRFQNTYISDDISRVARTPIRKLGFDERFIRPIRELKARNLNYDVLLDTVGMIFTYDEPSDEESVKLQQLLKDNDLTTVIKQVTKLTDDELIAAIAKSYQAKLAAK